MLSTESIQTGTRRRRTAKSGDTPITELENQTSEQEVDNEKASPEGFSLDSNPSPVTQTNVETTHQTTGQSSAPTPKSRTELAADKKKQQAKTARTQRKRHAELLEEWMPTQRGAVIGLSTKLGHQAIESWFKRTFLKHARMLWKIHTFPRVKFTYDDIAKIEQICLDAINKKEADLNRLIAQFDTMIAASESNMAHYQAHYNVDVKVSTRTGARLHAIYLKADEVALRLETLSLHGLIVQEKYAKALTEARKAVFGLCTRIEQLYTSLYIRAGATVPELNEDAPDLSAQSPQDQHNDDPIVFAPDESLPSGIPVDQTSPFHESSVLAEATQ